MLSCCRILCIRSMLAESDILEVSSQGLVKSDRRSKAGLKDDSLLECRER